MKISLGLVKFCLLRMLFVFKKRLVPQMKQLNICFQFATHRPIPILDRYNHSYKLFDRMEFLENKMASRADKIR